MKRTYHEVFLDPQPKSEFPGNDDPHAFLKMMPNDDIHANLRFDGSTLQTPTMEDESPSPLSWTSPGEWIEQKGSGMRLATFVNRDQDDPVETTLVSLGGEAGGTSANVIRWMQQLNIPVPSDQELKKWIEEQYRGQSSGGIRYILIDFTRMQTKMGPETPSMIAAMIEGQENQIFVKMTGSKQSVIKNFKPFRSLLDSIKLNATQ